MVKLGMDSLGVGKAWMERVGGKARDREGRGGGYGWRVQGWRVGMERWGMEGRDEEGRDGEGKGGG